MSTIKTNKIENLTATDGGIELYNTGDVAIPDGAKFRFDEGDGGANYVSFEAPTTLTTDYSFTLPTSYPAASGYALVSDTSGVMSWAQAGFESTAGATFADPGGDYGSVKITGGATGGWKGYAIENGAIFMQSNGADVFGLYDDTNNHWAIRHTKNAETKLYYDGSEKITTTSTGIDVTGRLDVDGGNIIPVADNTGEVGTSSNTWANGRFTNMTIDSTLSVRGAIDLADNDILRLGSGDDAELFCNGSHLYLDLNSGIGNFYIRDGTTNRFTFDDNGTLTASTFSNGGVRNGIKSSTNNQTGTYSLLTSNNSGDKAPGYTVGASALRWANCGGGSSTNTISGSWRLMGRIAGSSGNWQEKQASVWLRYA